MRPKSLILFNPVGVVHYRNIGLFENRLGDYGLRCILNPRFPWFAKTGGIERDHLYFVNDRVPSKAFEGVKAVVVFSAQTRLPSCHLIQEAALRSIPVIAIEEVHQMMLEQGFVSEYFLPVDHLFACSDFERQKFLEWGLPADVVEATGCIFSHKSDASSRRDGISKKLGLSEGKKTATLSLAYLTPSGETLDIRAQLLSTVSEGLPENYELIVKPHPAEADKDIDIFIRRYAPRAKIADRFMPIQDVLSVTDVLFNRGNSQVVINALRNSVPVVVVPMGRNTFFNGLLNELIVNSKEDIKKALGIVDKIGTALYEPIFKKFLSISPEEALDKAATRIIQIADNGHLYNPSQRLLEISLFWAWMGYVPQAIKTLAKVNKIAGAKSPLSEKIQRLISLKADYNDIVSLRQWAVSGYREWLIKSLWIKKLYILDRDMIPEDKDWLRDFPPRLNREYFMTYASMLCWCYLRSDMRPECELLLNRLYGEYSSLSQIQEIKKLLGQRKISRFDLGYWKSRLSHKRSSILKNAAWEISGIKV
ncbi:MAG: hypothetical protein V1933_04840 [Candidatus Omnitrophota bacterium]